MDAITPNLLEVRNCKQAYTKEASSDFIVLDNVDVTLKSGEIVGLLGRSGSGKSTLLRIVAGLLRPTEGQVIWRGTQLTGPAEGRGDGVSKFCIISLADRSGKRRTRPGGARRAPRRAGEARGGGDRFDRPWRL